MEVKEFSFSNGDYSFSFLNLGCTLTSFCGPDKDGKIENILLHYHDGVKNPSSLFESKANFGMTVGRFANRIGDASFKLNDKIYKFEANDGPNLLHSGKNSLRYRIWDVRKETDGFTCLVKVTEEEDGFPGNLDARVRFALSEDGNLRIHYSVSCSEDCPINLTNHAYFNLRGESSACEQTMLEQVAQFNSSRILAVDDGLIPNGQIIPVSGTEWDFTKPKTIGQDIESKKLLPTLGYDHAYVIDRLDGSNHGFTQFAKVYDKQSGRTLVAYTDLPAFHFYTGNYINGEEGYVTYGGFCLETEFYPNCVNIPQFPSCILKAGDLFESTTTFHLYARS